MKIKHYANWEIGKLGNWEIGKLGNWEIGKLGNWEIGKFILAICFLSLIWKCQAQNFIVSNLGNITLTPIPLAEHVSKGSWKAVPFTTNSNPYSLDSLTISLDVGFGIGLGGVNVDSHFVAIYDDSENVPGAEVARFSNPPTNLGGTNRRHRFDISTPIAVSENTRYWLVFGDSDTSSQNISSFTLFSNPFPNTTGQWQLGENHFLSGDQGSTWTERSFASISTTFHIGIAATIIPEPHEFHMISILSISIFILTRKSFFSSC